MKQLFPGELPLGLNCIEKALRRSRIACPLPRGLKICALDGFDHTFLVTSLFLLFSWSFKC